MPMPNLDHEREPSPYDALVAVCDAALTDRHCHLLDDLAVYRSKLADLERLDPLDFTGLQDLYRAHVSSIEQLLSEFDGADSPSFGAGD